MNKSIVVSERAIRVRDRLIVLLIVMVIGFGTFANPNLVGSVRESLQVYHLRAEIEKMQKNIEYLTLRAERAEEEQGKLVLQNMCMRARPGAHCDIGSAILTAPIRPDKRM